METIFNPIIQKEHKLNTKHARIITIEGIDGAGKTSVVDNCISELNKMGYKTNHFYTSSDLNVYWQIVKNGQKNNIINNDINQLLHNIAFLTYLKTLFIDLLNDNDFVISEWYIYGKMVLSDLYTGKETSLSKTLLQNELDNGNILIPNYSFFIDTNPMIAHDRIMKRNNEFESKETLEMLNYAYNLWYKYINKYNIEKINGDLSIEQIAEKVLKRVINK